VNYLVIDGNRQHLLSIERHEQGPLEDTTQQKTSRDFYESVFAYCLL